MTREFYVGLAGVLIGASFLLGCDPEPDARTFVDDAEIVAEVDDESLDVEPVRSITTPDDDPRGKDSHAHGPDYVREDVRGMQWADAATGTMIVPQVGKGEWTLEVRAHVGDHAMRWIQGPFDAAELGQEALTLDPPPEAFVAGTPSKAVRVMPRLVLRNHEGEQLTQLALPALVMQRHGQDVRFAQHNSMSVVGDRSGAEPLADADLPESL